MWCSVYTTASSAHPAWTISQSISSSASSARRSADEQVVLLIDEVDKADLEFPNDLLWELDKMEFYIPETKETIKPSTVHRHHHLERGKGAAGRFLRRCIFHYIEFPDQQQMEKIIRVHFDHVDETLLMHAMQAFYYIRSIDSVEKKPSTSELVDWIRALELTGVDTSRITKEIPFIGCSSKRTRISPPCSAD